MQNVKHFPEYPGILYMYPGAAVYYLAKAHAYHKKLENLPHVRV